MCGLAGVFGKQLNVVDRRAFRELLYVSALRGTHSTGVLAADVKNDGWNRVMKNPEEPVDFINRNFTFLSSAGFNIYMGHCRDATVGSVSKKNAHPFDTGQLVGAHNGTMHSSEFRQKGITDSEAMFNLMETDGIIPVLGRTRQWDAYAVSIYDKKDRTLSLATNGKRPLAVGICKDSDTVFWASEYLMLHSILSRNMIRADYFTLTKNVLYELSFDTLEAGSKSPWKIHEIPLPPRSSDDDLYDAWMSGTISSSEYAAAFNDAIPF